VRVLQNLFEVEMEKTNFSPAEVEAHANKMFDVPPLPGMTRVGLYLAHEFGVLGGWSQKPGQTEPTSIQIAESIVEISDPRKTWDETVARSIAYVEGSDEEGKEEEQEGSVGFGVGALIPEILLPESDLGWPIIHPEIAKVAESRFVSGHFADAAEAAFKVINERLKLIVMERLDEEYDGVALMQKAFSADKPVLVLDELSTMTGKDIQVGYQQIFSGAMRGIRNPKAHSNVQIDAVRSMHFIFLASLLMSKIDEALAREEALRKTAISAEPDGEEQVS
jgi:uncharacterized protein (TIGR02391 family)